MISISKRLDGIGEYYFSQKLREIDMLNKQGHKVINLGIGSPDLPPHPDVIRCLQEESAKPNVHAYQSYKGSPVLRRAMSDWYRQWYGVELDADREILPLIGSKEGIMHICMTYLNPGDKVLLPNPGYPTYRSAVSLAGGIGVDYTLSSEKHWQPDFEALELSDLKGVKLMFVNYPHMPTGELPEPGFFDELIGFARRHNILLVHDNPYSFILNESPASLLAVPGAKDIVIELNSLSKSHNMAGWRVGMMMAAAERIDEVLRFKSNMDSGMFLPLQLAAAKALSLGRDWYDSVNEVYRKRQKMAFELLDHLGAAYQPRQAGMFVWASVPSAYADGFAMSDAILHQASVFITPGGIFGDAGLHYIRVSLCSPEEQFAACISRVIEAGLSVKGKKEKQVNL